MVFGLHLEWSLISKIRDGLSYESSSLKETLTLFEVIHGHGLPASPVELLVLDCLDV